MNERRRILVSAAHPDDPEFAAGGTIANWVAEGHEIIYVISTNGNKGSSDPTMTSERLGRLREEEQRAAARLLGVAEVIFLGYPDGELEDTPLYRGEIVRLLRRYRPDAVLTMEPYRRTHQHRDHRVVGTVTLDAVYPYARDHLYYPQHLQEGLTPHKVTEVFLMGSDFPDYWVDISTTMERKLAAILCHTSQVGGRSREEILEGIQRRAAEVAKGNGMVYAEAFRRLELRR